MKKSILTFLFLILIPGVTICQTRRNTGTKPNDSLSDGNCTVYKFEKYSITLLLFSGPFEFMYFPTNPLPLNVIAKNYNLKFVANGSFFDGKALNAKHAGYLNIFGNLHSQVKKDRQLSHILEYCKGSDSFYIYPADGFTGALHSEGNSIAFQSGPLVIDNNMVSKDYILKSINGRDQRIRTLLGYTSNKKKVIIIVLKPVELDLLADYILSIPLFAKNKLTLINLDGGPSVAFYSKKFPVFNYNSTAQLPILIGIK